MNHLVLSVSVESSLKLLGQYADSILLDQEDAPEVLSYYETVYIRSHFSTPELQPQNFRNKIETIVQKVMLVNPTIRFIDEMKTVDAIVAFEDKWRQYQIYSDFMPQTHLLSEASNNFTRPIYKRRLSSRGAGVTWNRNDIDDLESEWIVQESLDITEELRVYIIHGKVYPVCTVRSSMTTQQKVQSVGSRTLARDEIEFALEVSKKILDFNMLGLDIVRTTGNALRLIEVNRSPGFGAFAELTGVNLAGILYEPDSMKDLHLY